MKFNLLLLIWLALMAGFTPQTAQAAAASPEAQVTLRESFRQVRAKGRRVLLRNDKPKKERGRVGRFLQTVGGLLVIASVIVALLFMVEGFLFYTPALFMPLFWGTSAASVVGIGLYLIGRSLEWLAQIFGKKKPSAESGS